MNEMLELNTMATIEPEYKKYIITERQKRLVINIEDLVVGVNQDVYMFGNGEATIVATTLNEVLEGIVSGMRLDEVFSRNDAVETLHESFEYWDLKKFYYELQRITEKVVESVDEIEEWEKKEFAIDE